MEKNSFGETFKTGLAAIGLFLILDSFGVLGAVQQYFAV